MPPPSPTPLSLLLLLFTILPFTTQTQTPPTTIPLLPPNTTLLSPNKIFTLSIFPLSPTSTSYYLGIYYTSLQPLTPIWIANRLTPLKDPSSSTLSLSLSSSTLTLSDHVNFLVWQSPPLPLPTPLNYTLSLLNSGNLVLYSTNNVVIWESFAYPTDTWLPGMNLTRHITLTSWSSLNNPSPGLYSVRLAPPSYGEVELVYNSTTSYWSSGNWTGTSFSNIPQMLINYIYRFYFKNPFTNTASFGFNEVGAGNDAPLTRFHVSSSGELRQYTWSDQTESWNSFWAMPEMRCKAYGLCGPFGVCHEGVGLCSCVDGFRAKDGFGWKSGDFSKGCVRKEEEREWSGGGGEDDGFVEVGVVGFDGEVNTTSFRVGDRSECERKCLSDLSCVGLVFSERNGNNNLCRSLFGVVLNIRNATSDNTLFEGGVLYLRVSKNGLGRKNQNRIIKVILIGVICGLVVVLGVVILVLLVMRKRRKREREEEAMEVTQHLRVFSYKELHVATRGFSEKVGHGGFGTVFRGALSDGSLVAVKRLERPGNGGEKEFRAEVCTIGNVQHVNLVRLRGFCSENSHRLLVYEYMPNGPLSGYLKKGDEGLNMSWDVRFRVAVGTARALSYLHEECRDCIIHCDIKPENILLDRDYVPKVSDFGLAKLIGRDFSRVLATMRGTWGYVAPEWISGVAITTKADVYSYGMTMLELIGGRRNVQAPPPSPPPVDHHVVNTDVDGGNNSSGGSGEKWFFPPWAASRIIEGKISEIIDQRLGPAYNRAEAERLAMAAVWCIQDDENERPSMGMVVKMLEGVVEVTVPPPPKLLQALVSGDSFPGIGVTLDSGNEDSSKDSNDGNGGGNCSDTDVRVSVDSLSHNSHGNGSPPASNAIV